MRSQLYGGPLEGRGEVTILRRSQFQRRGGEGLEGGSVYTNPDRVNVFT